MIDLNALNPEQRQAVEKIQGPLLVLAGAGSGKTRVLTYRVAHLIELGVPAWRILAITFTNKAAKEMQERVRQLAGDAAEEAWVSTFHACCARILRRDIEKLGYKRQFAIYDAEDQLTAVKAVARQLDLPEKEYPPRAIRAVISDAKNRLLSPQEWLRESPGDFRSKKLSEAYAHYEQLLRSNNALDFDDLLIKVLQLFADHPPVLEAYRERFDYILVDEYQDTNQAQYQLVRLLAGQKRNLCVVGDDDQSIYGWRGADIRNILDFEKDFPDCQTIKLERNYRSTGNILDAANQVIAHNQGRKEKALWTEAGAGEKLILYRALDERDEAAFIAATARQFSDVAVLYRTNAQSRVLEEAFVRAGVGYRVYGGLKFYDRKEVKDIVAYMRVLVNPDDDLSCRRIINEPKRSIGEATVESLETYARENGLSLLSAALDAENAGLSSRALHSVQLFAEIMMDLTEALYGQSPSAFLQSILEKTGYARSLEALGSEEAQARLENLNELSGAVSEFERLNPEGTTADFLENVALMTDLDGMEASSKAVTLMTLHSAKGLEFDTVFLAGMEEGVFPISRALFDDDQLEEERRLCYVGITRARKRLFLSCARSRALYNARNFAEPSRFLAEIPARVIGPNAKSAARTLPSPLRPDSRFSEEFSAPRGAWGNDFSGGGRSSSSGSRKTPSLPSFGAAVPDARQGFASPIPGVQKGFVPSAARKTAASVFAVGDTVLHRVFKRGVVVEVLGAGDSQRVRVRFDSGAEKLFFANAAPIAKVKE